jgi:hypothetical protein
MDLINIDLANAKSIALLVGDNTSETIVRNPVASQRHTLLKELIQYYNFQM